MINLAFRGEIVAFNAIKNYIIEDKCFGAVALFSIRFSQIRMVVKVGSNGFGRHRTSFVANVEGVEVTHPDLTDPVMLTC